MTESKHLWAPLRDHLSPLVHATRVENMSTPGMTDVEMCRSGVQAWVELKIAKNARWDIEVRHSQLVWITRRVRAGGRVFFLVRYRDQARLLPGKVVMQMPRVPVKGKKGVVRIKVDMVNSFWSDNAPFGWELLESRIFEVAYRRLNV